MLGRQIEVYSKLIRERLPHLAGAIAPVGADPQIPAPTAMRQSAASIGAREHGITAMQPDLTNPTNVRTVGAAGVRTGKDSSDLAAGSTVTERSGSD